MPWPRRSCCQPLICNGSHPDAAVFDPGDLLQQRPGRIAEEGLQARAGWAKRVLHGPVPQADELAVGEGGPAELDGKQMGVYRATEELYYAVELRCPHLGCRLEWNPDDKSWTARATARALTCRAAA